MILASIHPGLTLSQLEDDRSLAEDCRRFCLRTIRSTYGYDYRPEWHDDLDSLREPAACHYTASNRGAFFVLRNAEGHVVGTAGVRGLRYKPDIAAMFARRYPDTDRVAFNGRLYVDPAWRKQGLGCTLIALREEAARRLGYTTVYLHCDAKAERLRRYWLRQGFRLVAADDAVAHYDKPL
jgi:GNAT superfamily N-acetyltransferase